jgi:hypothetical protein
MRAEEQIASLARKHTESFVWNAQTVYGIGGIYGDHSLLTGGIDRS